MRSWGPLCATSLALKIVKKKKKKTPTYSLEAAYEPTDLQCFCVRFREKTKYISARSADSDETKVVSVESFKLIPGTLCFYSFLNLFSRLPPLLV